MNTFTDQFVAENDKKFAIYRNNIPNFEATIIDMSRSIENIQTLLQHISTAKKSFGEDCAASCPNCSAMKEEKVLQRKNHDSPQETLQNKKENSSLEHEEDKDQGTEKSKENEVRFVAQVSEQEFKSIPKYQLGRLTCDNLNEIVQKMDEFLMKKNKVFGKSNKQLTRLDRELLDNWKELELKAKGRLPTTLFFVESDIRPLLQERLRPSFAKAIPCLRHIRRVREERCGPLTFYYT